MKSRTTKQRRPIQPLEYKYYTTTKQISPSPLTPQITPKHPENKNHNAPKTITRDPNTQIGQDSEGGGVGGGTYKNGISTAKQLLIPPWLRELQYVRHVSYLMAKWKDSKASSYCPLSVYTSASFVCSVSRVWCGTAFSSLTPPQPPTPQNNNNSNERQRITQRAEQARQQMWSAKPDRVKIRREQQRHDRKNN